jgi:phytoene dehydrogenase-like protein
MKGRYDAIVIGGGHNGLVAAFYLARAGQSVLVLERRDQVGGPASTIEFLPGYRGAITNSPGSLEPKIVADMQLEVHGLRWVKPDPAVLMPFPDGRFFVGWRDQARVRDTIARTFSARDADAYPRVFEFFNDFARRLGVSLFEPPPSFAELTSRLKTPQDEADFARIFFGSIRDLLEDQLESEELRTAIAMLSMAGAVAPSMPGTAVALLQRPMSLFSSNAAGTHDPRNQPLRGSTGLPLGGMGSITEAMRRSVEALGVTVRTGAAVKDIVVSADGSVTGVALADGSEFRAPLVLSNLDARTTLLRMVEPRHVAQPVRDRLDGLPIGASPFKVVLAVDTPPLFAGAPPDEAEAYSSCQIRISPDMEYLETGHRDYLAGRVTRCPRLLGLIPSFTDPTLAPEGRHYLSFNAWFFPYELQGTDWSVERDRLGAHIHGILSEYIPTLKHSVTAMRCYSPVDLEQEFGLIGGNFSHLDMTPAQHFGFRPIPDLSRYRTPVRGLYLCGSSSWPGGTVTGLPGHNAAHQALCDLSGNEQTQRRASQ